MPDTQWPSTGRGHRAGEGPTEPQLAALLFVYRMGSGPVGEPSTKAEIQAEVEVSDEDLADALSAGWLRVTYWQTIGGGVRDLDAWDTTDAGAAILRDRQAKAIPEHEHVWREAETKVRFDPPWESCSVCKAWRTGPDQPTMPPEL